jgi:hypothetical protein
MSGGWFCLGWGRTLSGLASSDGRNNLNAQQKTCANCKNLKFKIYYLSQIVILSSDETEKDGMAFWFHFSGIWVVIQRTS